VNSEASDKLIKAWKKSMANLIAEEYVKSEYTSFTSFICAVYGSHVPDYENDNELFEKLVAKNAESSMNEALE